MTGIKTKRERHETLRNLMERHGLEARDLIEILRISSHTAQSWMRQPSNRASRSPSQAMLDVLRMRLENRDMRARVERHADPLAMRLLNMNLGEKP